MLLVVAVVVACRAPHHAAVSHTIECAYIVKVVYNIPKSINELLIVAMRNGAAATGARSYWYFFVVVGSN